MDFIKDLFVKNELKSDTPDNVKNAYEIAYYTSIVFFGVLVLKVAYPLFYIVNSIFSFYIAFGILAIGVAVFVSIEAKYNKDVDDLKKSFEDLKTKVSSEEEISTVVEDVDPDDDDLD